MSKWKIKTVELVMGLAFTNKKNPAVVPFKPSKTEVSSYEPQTLHRSTPERRGISSKRIYDLLVALENSPRANLHNLIIVKDGEVISECSHPGYSINIRHLSHSMSKTLTGMAIGILCSEGKISLDTKLCDIFPEYEPVDKRFYKITIHHLLSMTSGVPFSEAGAVTENNWTRAFFDSKLSFAPGSTFAYNSMNSYMLARIAVRVSGMSLTDFLSVHIFKPLDITNVFWEIGPEGVEKGGWGVHLSAESWAKLGIMMLNGGSYEGKRVLPESWVIKSTTTQMAVHESAGDFNYGYQIWVSRENNQFLFNGMLGQNVWVCPKNNIVVVANCENNELFQKSAVLENIQKYLGGDISGDLYNTGALMRLRDKERHFFESRHWIKPLFPRKGLTFRLGLRSKTPLPGEWNKLLGTYTFAQNNQGMLPLIIRAMQNNYTGGIEMIVFEREGERLFMTSREGGIDYRFEIGLYEFKTTVLNINGERYIMRTLAEAARDEDGKLFYKIELLFPEMPNSRKLKLIPQKDDRLVLHMTENPNDKIAEPLVEAIYTTTPKLAFAVKLIEARLGDRYLNRKLESVFSPTLVGANTKSEHYYDIVADEKQRAQEIERTTKAISTMIINAADTADSEEK
jgi:CubicO group peptidase (beta-lactamase class C family)